MRSNPVRPGAVRYGAPIVTPPSVMHARPPSKVAQIAPTPPPSAVPAAPAVREFKTFAEYLRAVVAAANGEGVDRRLQRAPTGLSEGVPADGGFLVPERTG